MLNFFQPITSGKALLIILFAWACDMSSYAQNCEVLINPSVTQFTSGITEVGQSVTMTNCASGNFSSITIYSNSPHTDARLKIFKDKGMGGDLLYTQTGITINLDLVNGTTIDLTSAVPFTGGQSYTFILDFTAGGTWQLHKSNINLYSEGTLYENGNQVANQDLRFMVESDASLLPVELTHFAAREQQGQILLDWQTASEQNNKGFEVERSHDGKEWEIIGFVTGQGNSGSPHEYRFWDRFPFPGNNFYRLRQIDLDGQFDYSPVRSVVIENNGADSFSFFPNPVAAGQTLNLINLGEQVTGVQLTDWLGRPVAIEFLAADRGGSQQLTVPAGLQSGMYLLILFGENGQSVRKLSVR